MRDWKVHRRGLVCAAALWFMAAGCAPPASTPSDPDLPDSGADGGLQVQLETPDTCVAGTTQPVAVVISQRGAEPVTALALEVHLPPEWQYAGVAGALRPAIEPAAGARDALAFVWIETPAFPARLDIRLDVPAAPIGACTLSARARYRELGGELQSPVHEVTIVVQQPTE